MPASPPLVIHCLVPFSTYSPPSSLAVVWMPLRVAARVGLGEAERHELLARRDVGKIFLLLCVRAVEQDGIGPERIRRVGGGYAEARLGKLFDGDIEIKAFFAEAAVLLRDIDAERSAWAMAFMMSVGNLLCSSSSARTGTIFSTAT